MMTKADHPLPNLSQLDEDTYIVRTQAGFRKLIKERTKKLNEEHGMRVFCTENYPTKYPSVVYIRYRYSGMHIYYPVIGTLEELYLLCTAKLEKLKQNLSENKIKKLEKIRND